MVTHPEPVTVAHVARRQELLAKAEAREKARAEAKQQAELEQLELVDRFETELGPLGQQFQIVDATELGEGFVVVKLGDEVAWKRYSNSKMNEADTHDFVFPYVVHPAKEKYQELVARRPFVASRCAAALASLFGVKLKADEGKF